MTTGSLRPWLRRLLTISCCLPLLGAAPSSTANDLFLKPYHIEFKADYKFLMPFKGKAERTLNKLEDGSWLLTNNVSSRLIKVRESSQFNWQRALPIPTEYQYSLNSLVKSKNEGARFDYASNKVYSSFSTEEAEYELVDGLIDRLSYQTALRMDLMKGGTTFSYQVADKRGPRELKFEVLGEELVETDLGTFNTVKVKRVRKPDSKRETLFWLAKDWDYLLIRLSHAEKGTSYVMEMSSGLLDGRAITGLSGLQPTAN